MNFSTTPRILKEKTLENLEKELGILSKSRFNNINFGFAEFQELLDVRDNLKLPIMYYSVSKHLKCYFYITYQDRIYLNVVKAVDM